MDKPVPDELAQIIATHKALFGGFTMMADDQSNDGGDNSGATPPAKTFEPITTQDDLNKIIGDRVQRVKSQYADYDALKQKAEQFDQLQDAGKTDQQRAADQAAQFEATKSDLEARLQAKDLEILRLTVAHTKGVPAHRINGTTEAELTADADRYLGELGGARKPGYVPSQGGGEARVRSGRERAQAFVKKNNT